MQQGIKKLQWFEYLKGGISQNIKYAIMSGFCKSGHIINNNSTLVEWVASYIRILLYGSVLQSEPVHPTLQVQVKGDVQVPP